MTEAEYIQALRAKEEEIARLSGKVSVIKREVIERVGDCDTWSDALSRVLTLRAENERLKGELERVREELNWQNHRNASTPNRGGFEFYINEEWTWLAGAAMDAEDATSTATLSKRRYDPDDERVRVRRVIEDDAILNDIASLRSQLGAVKRERDEWLKQYEAALDTANTWIEIRNKAVTEADSLRSRVGELEAQLSTIRDLAGQSGYLFDPVFEKVLTPPTV